MRYRTILYDFVLVNNLWKLNWV